MRQVEPGSPAQTAGLQPGDVITQLNDIPMVEPAALASVLKLLAPGAKLKFDLLRNGKKLSVTVTAVQKDRKALVETALQRGRAFLLSKQRAEDGAWNHFQSADPTPGMADTALAAWALSTASAADEATRPALDRALAFLLKHQRPDGAIAPKDEILGFVNYASALTLTALIRRGGQEEPARKLADFLRSRQLASDSGQGELDSAHGAWDYYDLNQKDLMRGDLSITSFVLEALGAVGWSPDQPVARRALLFVSRCQNFVEGEASDAPATDAGARDGGFFFTPRESKAGMQVQGGQRTGFAAYGSMTADGLRSLRNLGLGPEDPRVRAALGWIAGHFDVARNPGFVPDAPVPFAEGIYYYYLHGLAKALAACGQRTLPAQPGEEPVAWAAPLVDALLSRQALDGSWSSKQPLMNEDQPQIATPFALEALQACLPYL